MGYQFDYKADAKYCMTEGFRGDILTVSVSWLISDVFYDCGRKATPAPQTLKHDTH